MSMTIFPDDKEAAPDEIELDIEEMEEVISPRIVLNHNETLVSDEVELNVEELVDALIFSVVTNISSHSATSPN